MSLDLSLAALVNGLALDERKSQENAGKPLVGSMLSGLLKNPIKTQRNELEYSRAVHLVYKIARSAIESVEKGKLVELDPLVGDCACQMRALMIADFVRNYQGNKEFAKEVAKMKATLTSAIGVLVKKISVLSLQTKVLEGTVQQLITREDMEISVTPEILMLAQCYLLTKTKHHGNEETLCHDCEKAVSGLTDVTAEGKLGSVQKDLGGKTQRSIVECAKMALSAASCAYVMKDAPCDVDDLAKHLLSKTHIKEIYGRQELPCYASCVAVFAKAKVKQIPILLKVKKAAHTTRNPQEKFDVALLLKPAENGGSYQAVLPKKEDLEAPVIVIEGQRSGQAILAEGADQYLARLMRQRFMTLIRLNAAAHKPYSDAKLAIANPELERIAKIAKEVGACHENQSLFSITHIFCDILKNQKVAISGGKEQK